MVMKKISGFTLIELMITLAIVAIVASLGTPSLRQFIQNAKINTATNDLVSALHVARTQAIREGQFGCVCPSSTASDAVPACLAVSVNNPWEQGWIAFLDSTGNCTFEAATDVLLKVKDTSENTGAEFAIRNNHLSINGSNFVRFNSKGVPETAPGQYQQGTWSICDVRGLTVGAITRARGVQITTAGSIRTTKLIANITQCPF